MNWLRILVAVTLGSFLIFAVGVVWIGPPHRKSARPDSQVIARLFPCKATIVVQLKTAPPTTPDSAQPDSLRSSDLSLESYARLLRSQHLWSRAVAKFTPAELTSLLGVKFMATGRTPFKGVRIVTLREGNDRKLAIIASHHEAAAAQLVATQLYAELIQFFREQFAEDHESLLQQLKARRDSLITEVGSAEIDLKESQRTGDAASVYDAELKGHIMRRNLREIEQVISQIEIEAKTPKPLQFQVTQANVVSGPFWNRTVTDFTADVVKFEAMPMHKN